MLVAIISFYFHIVMFFFGWNVGCDRELRPQPSTALQLLAALCWPAVVWYAYKKWRSLR